MFVQLKSVNLSHFFAFNLDEETGCTVGDYTISSRRRWNYENNCAAIVCYVSTGLASSSTQLTELSGDIIQRHQKLATALTADNVTDVLTYIVNKLLKAKCAQSSPIIDPTMLSTTNSCNNNNNNNNNNNSNETRVPAIHLKVFYQVSSTPPINLIIQTISEFREQNADRVSIAFSVLPASSLHNFSTFLSIYGIRHA